MPKASFNKKDSFRQQIGFKFKGEKVLVKCYIWSVALCGAGT